MRIAYRRRRPIRVAELVRFNVRQRRSEVRFLVRQCEQPTARRVVVWRGRCGSAHMRGDSGALRRCARRRPALAATWRARAGGRLRFAPRVPRLRAGRFRIAAQRHSHGMPAIFLEIVDTESGDRAPQRQPHPSSRFGSRQRSAQSLCRRTSAMSRIARKGSLDFGHLSEELETPNHPRDHRGEIRTLILP